MSDAEVYGSIHDVISNQQMIAYIRELVEEEFHEELSKYPDELIHSYIHGWKNNYSASAEAAYYIGDERRGVENLFFVFHLVTLQNCKHILISYATKVGEAWRGKGISYRVHKIKEQIAQFLGCSALMCTVNNSNIPEVKSLLKTGWERVSQSQGNGGDIISIFVKNIYKE